LLRLGRWMGGWWGIWRRSVVDRRGRRIVQKVVDVTTYLTRPWRGAMLVEEVWESGAGEVVKYNLGYVNPKVCGLDNGRVLGYDNSHGYHHRHFMGKEEPFEFKIYDAVAARFYREVRDL
jgi:hypothetical protein